MTLSAPRLATPAVALSMLTLALVAPVATQTPAPAAPGAGASKVSVEGCLTKEGGAATSLAADLYVLVVPTAAPTRGDTAPSAGGTIPAPALPKMYVLRSAPEAKIPFASFVNHRVKVEGTSTDGATSAPLAGRSPEATPYQAPVATGSAGSGATGTPFDRANLPTLVARTVTSLAATCR
jgi:hypothetical protein